MSQFKQQVKKYLTLKIKNGEFKDLREGRGNQTEVSGTVFHQPLRNSAAVTSRTTFAKALNSADFKYPFILEHSNRLSKD